MKKRKILAVILIVLAQIAFAGKKDSTKVTLADSLNRINEISWVFTEVIDGGWHFRYERKLGNNISAAVSLGIKGEEGLINLSGIDTEKIKTSDITYSGFKVVPEVRYYIGKTQQYKLDGFYFGAYMKLTQYNSHLFGTYINKEGKEFRIDADARLNLLTLGLGVGYKLALNDRWNFDFIIAGPGATRHNYKLTNNVELPEDFYDDLVNALENYSFFDLINSDFEFSQKNRRTKFLFPAFRYGLTIGYTFQGKK